MYGWIWGRLPGPRPLKVIIVLVALAAIFFLLMEVVFPWVSALMPYSDVAV